MTYEEARLFLINYYTNNPTTSVAAALSVILDRDKKMISLLETFAELHNKEGNDRLMRTGQFDKFNSPFTVEMARKLIMEL